MLPVHTLTVVWSLALVGFVAASSRGMKSLEALFYYIYSESYSAVFEKLSGR